MLEVGIGNGDVACFLKNKGIDMEGADIFPEAIANCKKILDIPLHQMDALKIPFRERYDIIGAFDLLEHIDNDTLALKNIFSACKTGGKIIVTVPAMRLLWGYFDIGSHHKRRYSKRELKEKMEEAGFKIERISFFMTLLFPVLFIYRLLFGMTKSARKVETGRITISPEHKPTPILNNIMLFIFRIEKCLLNFVNLPFGTSLIAIARKV